MTRTLSFLCLLFITFSLQSQTHQFPPTTKQSVSSEYHDVDVAEDYRWLENFDDAAVKEWVRTQNAHSRAYLDAVPFRSAVANRLKELLQNRPVMYSELSESNGKLFALKDDPKKNQKSLVFMSMTPSGKSEDDANSEQMVLDPTVLSPQGTTAIDWFAPSGDGMLVAVCLSENGSEDGTLNIYESETGKKLPDVIPGVQYPTGGGSVSWDKDGIYYTRFPREVEKPKEDMHFYQQVYYHKLGSSEDTYVIGKEFPRIAEIRLSSGDNFLLATVANGDGGEFAHWLRRNGKWAQITRFDDGAVSVSREGEYLYLLSRKNAPRGEILKMPLSRPELSAAKIVIPSSEVVIKEFSTTSDRMYVVDLVGGPQQVRVFDLDGSSRGIVPMKRVASVGQVVTLSNGEVLYSMQTYTEPLEYFRFNPMTGRSSKAGLVATSSQPDFSDTEVKREFAVSKDGTRVPLNIVRRKGTVMDGKNPVLLYGYGGYSISLTPEARYWLRMWIDQGGVYAEATLRGGGEFGEEWHRAGNLTRKQNVFDDFAACAQWLIDHNYTSPLKLAIMGASNGGLLMGAELTQHPDMFRAVVSRVGIYDMLRVELSPNGSFNTTEFGSVKDPVQFKALYSYSPYHHVKDGTKYPAVLMPTGDQDGRVDPLQSRKMVARLQSATSSGYPVLLRTTAHAGHGMGTSKEEFLSEQTDIFVFLMDQLGMTFKPLVP